MKSKTNTSKKLFRLRGREFSESELKLIDEITKQYFEKGRTKISEEVCKELNWVQPNGWLKDRACREVLQILNEKGFIKLPESKSKIIRIDTDAERKIKQKKLLETIPVFETKSEEEFNFKNIKIEMVKGTQNENIWNVLVNEYHYLGFNHFVGRSLKYIIYYNELIIGAICFCDPAWSITSRDSYLTRKLAITKDEIRLHGINNGRFLLLPWIRIPNLASNVLSKSIKIVKKDWMKYYNIIPFYIETFVDSTRFKGTCYKASNWELIGITKGFKKSGNIFCNSQVPKHILIYYLF